MIKIKPRVLLLCALKIRDLASLIVLKLMLNKRGIDAKIIHAHANKDLIKYYPCSLVVFPHIIGETFINIANYKKRKGSIICILSTENLSKTYEDLCRIYITVKESINMADIFFAWSKKTKDILIKNKIIEENKIKVLGCPRFDFYSPEFINKLYDKKDICTKYNIDSNKKIITWATGYAYNDVPRDHAIANLKKIGFDTIINIEAYVDDECKFREMTVSAFFSVAEKFKDVQFIIKVHPSELSAVYDKKQETVQLPNVKILREPQAVELILISDAWLHWNSTTSLEACLLNKPTINLAIGPAKKYLFKEIEDASITIYNEKELEKYVDLVIKDKKIITKEIESKRKKILKEWLGPVDGKSIERHADEITNLLKNKKMSLNQTFNFKYALFKMIDMTKRILGLEIHENLFRTLLFRKKYVDERQKFFSRKELKELQQKYRALVN